MSQNFCNKHQLQLIAVCINKQCDENGNICMRCLKEKHQSHVDDCIDMECYQKIMEIQMLQREIIHWRNQFNQTMDQIVGQITLFLEQKNKFDSAIVKFKNFEITKMIEQIQLQENEQLEQIQQIRKILEIELKDSVIQDLGMTQNSQYLQTQNFKTGSQNKIDNQIKQNSQINQVQLRKQNQNSIMFTELQCQKCEQYYTKNMNQTLPDGYCQECAISFQQPIECIPKLKQMSQFSEGLNQSKISKLTQREERQSLKNSQDEQFEYQETQSNLQEQTQNQQFAQQVQCDVCQMKYFISDLFVNNVCQHKSCISCIHQIYKDKLTTKCLVSLCTEQMNKTCLKKYYNEQMSILSGQDQ